MAHRVLATPQLGMVWDVSNYCWNAVHRTHDLNPVSYTHLDTDADIEIISGLSEGEIVYN